MHADARDTHTQKIDSDSGKRKGQMEAAPEKSLGETAGEERRSRMPVTAYTPKYMAGAK